ncbi:MAG TPA: hypothetical protein VGE43_19595 [Acidimicrobiales bacterium]
MTAESPDHWEWCGAPHHFIGAPECHFHLATWVAGGRYLVSTVGDYRPAGSDSPMKAIGAGEAYFETYIFETDPDDRGDQGDGGHPSVVSWSNVDGERWKTHEEANAGHLRYCRKWAQR